MKVNSKLVLKVSLPASHQPYHPYVGELNSFSSVNHTSRDFPGQVHQAGSQYE